MSVKVLAKDKIVQAYNLINHLEPLSVCNVFGVQKLKRKIEAEIKFLNKSLRSNDINEEHIHCSNIGQLASLVEVATTIPGVTAVLKSFDIGDGEKLIIDVVGENNCKWYKVILRNPKALHQLHIFGGRNGVRPLDKVAQDILNAAKANPVFFVPPKVCFYFVNGVSERLAKSLRLLGVEVKGQIKTSEELGIPTTDVADSSDEENQEATASRPTTIPNSTTASRPTATPNSTTATSEKKHSKTRVKASTTSSQSPTTTSNAPSPASKEARSAATKREQAPPPAVSPSQGQAGTGPLYTLYRKVNLDVTSLIAFVSATSNGGCNYVFQDQVLSEQAKAERNKPVKDILNAYFKGRELVVCEEAARHFQSILLTIGGDAELQRGQELLKRCTVVSSQDIFKGILKKGGRIKELSRLIFGTGQALKAPTITSNRGFVRAAENQGLKLAVLYHEPRALTEKKESTAEVFHQS